MRLGIKVISPSKLPGEISHELNQGIAKCMTIFGGFA
jgi:hypothetical protein